MTKDVETSRGEMPRQPLAPLRWTLIAGAGGLLVLYYIFCTVAMVFVSALLLIDGALYLRSGMLYNSLVTVSRIARLIITSMFLGKGVEYSVPVPREAAPALWEMVEDMAGALGTEPPSKIVTSMSANASVELEGYKTGQGQSTLMLGYDFLAGLSVAELRAVLGHELGHTLLVQRGYRKWVAKGLARMSNLAIGLDGLTSGLASEKAKSHTANALSKITHALGHRVSRLFGVYSRHSELEADRLAALTCGTEIVKQTLARTAIIGYKSSGVTDHRRMMQTQRNESFSEWLRAELTPNDEERSEIESKISKYEREDDFDTHPPLSVRLSALPEAAGYTEPSDAPATTLLNDPDALADALMRRTEEIWAKLQSDDTSKMLKAVKGRAGSPKFTGLQGLGLVMIIFAAIIGVIILISFATHGTSSPDGWIVCAVCAAFVALGGLLVAKNGFKETLVLPVPEYGVWRKEIDFGDRRALSQDRLDEITSSIAAQKPANIVGKKAVADYYLAHCYHALEKCDYGLAYAAANLCMQADKRCMEGFLGLGISAAHFRQGQESAEALNKVFAKRNLAGSLPWGLGWATMLLGQWDYAEGYLLTAIKQRPKMVELLPYLVRCQWERGKVLEALSCSRRLVAMAPGSVEYHTQLVHALLAAGKSREADRELDILEPLAPDDFDIMIARVGTNGLLGRRDECFEQVEKCLLVHPVSRMHVRLGQVLDESGHDDAAIEHYETACAQAFWPEALVGLAHIRYKQKDYEQARSLLYSAMDLTRTPEPGSKRPDEVWDAVFEGLMAMGEPVDGCTAYDAKIAVEGLPDGCTHVSLLVVAPDAEQANELVQKVYSSLRPDSEAPVEVEMQPLPRESQPDSAIVAGIHGFRPA